MKKIIFLFIFASFLFGTIIFSPTTASAATPTQSVRKLEIEYPEIPGIQFKPEFVTAPLPQYVAYIFYFIIGAAGIIALAVIVIAGFRYVASAGMPEKLRDAKNQISSALLGLVILLSSVLILNTINPELLQLRDPKQLPSILPSLSPGVYLCKEAVPGLIDFPRARAYFAGQSIEQQRQISTSLYSILTKLNRNCYWQQTRGGLPEEFDGKVSVVYLIPFVDEEQFFETRSYGAFLYEKSNFGGGVQPIYDTGKMGEIIESGTGDKVASVRPFIFNTGTSRNWFVKLYQLIAPQNKPGL